MPRKSSLIFHNIVPKIFRKMDQGPQVLWLGPKGPTDGAQSCSLSQELEKPREAGYFTSSFIFVLRVVSKNKQTFIEMASG